VSRRLHQDRASFRSIKHWINAAIIFELPSHPSLCVDQPFLWAVEPPRLSLRATQDYVPIIHPFELSSHQDCASEPSRECTDQPPFRAEWASKICADQPPFRAFETPRLCVNEPLASSFCANKLRAFRAVRTNRETAAYFQQNQLRTFNKIGCTLSESCRAIEPSGLELRACDMGTVGQSSYQHSSLPIQSKNSCALSANSAAYFQTNQVIVQRLIIAIEPSRLELRFSGHQASSPSRNSSFILWVESRRFDMCACAKRCAIYWTKFNKIILRYDQVSQQQSTVGASPIWQPWAGQR